MDHSLIETIARGIVELGMTVVVAPCGLDAEHPVCARDAECFDVLYPRRKRAAFHVTISRIRWEGQG